MVTLRGNQIGVDSGASTTFEISNHARHILLVMHFHAHYFTRHVASSYAQLFHVLCIIILCSIILLVIYHHMYHHFTLVSQNKLCH